MKTGEHIRKGHLQLRFGLNTEAKLDADIYCVLGKDYDDWGNLKMETLLRTRNSAIKPRDFLQPGEVLFAAKGTRNYAAVWKSEVDYAVASSTFMIFTVNPSFILPEFLAWYLNSAATQDYFKEKVVGSTVLNIRRSVLEDLDMDLPPLGVQHKIAHLDALWKREKELLRRISEKKNLLVNSMLLKLSHSELRTKPVFYEAGEE